MTELIGDDMPIIN